MSSKWDWENNNTKPFAWMEDLAVSNYINDRSDGDVYRLLKKPSNDKGKWLPLYTHQPIPQEVKEKMAKAKANQILMDLIDNEDWNKGCTMEHLISLIEKVERHHGIK